MCAGWIGHANLYIKAGHFKRPHSKFYLEFRIKHKQFYILISCKERQRFWWLWMTIDLCSTLRKMSKIWREKKIYFGGFQNDIPWRRKVGVKFVLSPPPPLCSVFSRNTTHFWVRHMHMITHSRELRHKDLRQICDAV